MLSQPPTSVPTWHRSTGTLRAENKTESTVVTYGKTITQLDDCLAGQGSAPMNGRGQPTGA